LCAGFPCQPFSIAGRREGFDDTRGTLFYDILQILEKHNPKAILLENVKNLMGHDNGKTFATIKNALESLGYVVHYKVMNAAEFANIPQNRERVFIVCFDPKQTDNYDNFRFPPKLILTKNIKEYIAPFPEFNELVYTDRSVIFLKLASEIVDENAIYQWRRKYVRRNKNNLCPTLTANMGTGGHNVPIIFQGGKIRKLSPRECLNFQGFPENYSFPMNIPISAMYKQAGNSVVVPLVVAVMAEIVKTIDATGERHGKQ
jgi:DNA (cytosine-5)-methyltransferase 1